MVIDAMPEMVLSAFFFLYSLSCAVQESIHHTQRGTGSWAGNLASFGNVYLPCTKSWVLELVPNKPGMHAWSASTWEWRQEHQKFKAIASAAWWVWGQPGPHEKTRGANSGSHQQALPSPTSLCPWKPLACFCLMNFSIHVNISSYSYIWSHIQSV